MIYFYLFVVFLIHLLYYIDVKDNEDVEKSKRNAFKNYFFSISIMYLMIFFFLKTKIVIVEKTTLVFIFVGTSLILIYAIKRKIKSSKEQDVILAKQSSYWDIDKKDILNKYKNRIVKKKGRNEVEIDNEEYFIIKDSLGEKSLRGLIYKDISQEPEITFIKNTDFIYEISEVYSKIFNKIKDINEDAELGIDFEKELYKNKFIAEFFLMSLWEETTKSWNINSTTLLPLAKDLKDIELIGALDALKNINTTKKGIVLLAHYFNFKGRL